MLALHLVQSSEDNRPRRGRASATNVWHARGVTTNEFSNTRAPSTTWTWKRVRITQPPQANGHASASALSIRQLSKRDRRKPLTIAVKYRGGPECWWEIRARGAVIRVPGHAALHDVLDALSEGNGR